MRLTGTALLGGVMLLGGCEEEVVATLVPVRCGIEPEDLDGLQVETVGDFPPSEAVSLRVGADGARLEGLPPGVTGITVEGLFGEQLEAVGRTARIAESGEMAVYFSPPDTLCNVVAPVAQRTIGALGVLSNGGMVGVGGRDALSRLLDTVVVYSDTSDAGLIRDARLAQPGVAQTVHPVGPRSVLVVGGAGNGSASFNTLQRVDLGADLDVRVHDPQPMMLEGTIDAGRSHHAGVVLPDGEVLVTGGCTNVVQTQCVESLHSVLASTRLIAPSTGAMEVGPPLLVARYDHTLLRSRDGVVFAVGGIGRDGRRVLLTEALLPGATSWLPYGRLVGDELPQGEAIMGATLLEGGIVVLLASDGRLLWVDQNNVGEFDDWCLGGGTPCPLNVEAGPAEGYVPRQLATLPGGRVLIDHHIVAPASFNLSGLDAIDLSAAGGAPEARYGALTHTLADGTVVVVGGLDQRGRPVASWLTRFRPRLDGPDEAIPNLAVITPGTFVVHQSPRNPPRIDAIGATLILDNTGEDDDGVVAPGTLRTWAHVQSFRSRRFQFKVAFEALQRARPWLVFTGGAFVRFDVRFDPDAVRFVERAADGSATQVRCGFPGLDFSGVGREIQVDVSPDAVVVRSRDEIVARCPGIGDVEVSVGLGVVGEGTVRASNMRLTRT